jgi:hypothetical protein
MTKRFANSQPEDVLVYSDGKRRGQIVRRAFVQWRLKQDPPVTERCDNEVCCFHSATLEWNGKPLKLILDHKNGVNTDNRHSNLRFLCPNCDAQNSETKGGANKHRVTKSVGGFAIKSKSGLRAYTLPADAGRYTLHGSDVTLTHVSATGKPECKETE